MWTMKKTLSDERKFVMDPKEVTEYAYPEDEVKQFIKEILEEIDDIDNPEIIARWGKDTNERIVIKRYVSEWKKVKKQFIKQKAGEKLT